MNAKKNYTKGARREVARLLSLSGVVTYKTMGQMKGNRRMIGRLVKKMKEEGVIEIYNTPRRIVLKGASLGEMRNALTKEQEEYYIRNVSESAKYAKGSYTDWNQKGVRQIRQSEINGMVYESGIGIMAGEKPQIGEKIADNDSVYYTLKEIRRYWENIAAEEGLHPHARGYGVLISPGGIYMMYHSGKSLMQWEAFSEIGTVMKLTRYINGCITERIETIKEAVILGNDAQLFARMVLYEKKYGRTKNTVAVAEAVYDRLYGLPNNIYGRKMLEQMHKAGWRNRMYRMFPQAEEIEASRFCSVQCDGYDKEKDRYTLLFCVPDLIKLKNYSARACLIGDREKFRVICFEHQLGTVANVIPEEYCRVYSLPYETYEKRVGIYEEEV